MDKTFDELFNEFFKNNKPKNNGSLMDMHEKMIKMLSDFKVTNNVEKTTENKVKQNLGKPDKIEFYNEGNIFYEKRTWHTKDGDLIELIITDDPNLLPPPIPQKSLQEKLEEAVNNEEYMKAAVIRDLIKKKK